MRTATSLPSPETIEVIETATSDSRGGAHQREDPRKHAITNQAAMEAGPGGPRFSLCLCIGASYLRRTLTGSVTARASAQANGTASMRVDDDRA